MGLLDGGGHPRERREARAPCSMGPGPKTFGASSPSGRWVAGPDKGRAASSCRVTLL
eukprot:CAMPEP_0172562800 /NCGR_PEP_ID=MMETSP1067-20121228/98504_1 /TAXON_ID=265564 ORGANISM="Thalassiosira punctigera, Strain Tpunct2005C2" /NCGR_SAMPLE_ID=MMETSP1067 /ASSEMBLY_ACC=CAM_ASM_000444 /LENGTH=56 /DNA_ID=CAMNT_0013353105 /DNA_START=95 /DNA_END=261 /DNA_ORIENTATION=-